MKTHGLFSALIGLSALLPAQTPKPNSFHVYDGSTEFTTRGTIGNNEGECLNKVHGGHFGFLRPCTKVQYVLQDQNDQTAEYYWFIFRKSDPQTHKPLVKIDPQTGKDLGIIAQFGKYSYSGTGSGGAVAWIFTFTLPKPVILPDGEFFYGIHFAKGSGAGWTKDAGSIHMSDVYPGQACGEHARLGYKPHMAWCITYTNGKPDPAKIQEPSVRSFWVKLWVQNPVVQPYTIDPAAKCTSKQKGQQYEKDLGFAALWPDLVDLEKYGYKADFGWRVREVNYPSGVALVFLASKQLPLPINLPFGKWYLLPSDREWINWMSRIVYAALILLGGVVGVVVVSALLPLLNGLALGVSSAASQALPSMIESQALKIPLDPKELSGWFSVIATLSTFLVFVSSVVARSFHTLMGVYDRVRAWFARRRIRARATISWT